MFVIKSLESSRQFFSASMMLAFCSRNLRIATEAEFLLINSLLKLLRRPRSWWLNLRWVPRHRSSMPRDSFSVRKKSWIKGCILIFPSASFWGRAYLTILVFTVSQCKGSSKRNWMPTAENAVGKTKKGQDLFLPHGKNCQRIIAACYKHRSRWSWKVVWDYSRAVGLTARG